MSDDSDPDNPFTVNPHDLSREDEAVRDDTFRAWLWRVAADSANPYYRLRTVIGPSGAPFGGKYDEEKYAAHLERLAPEEPELVESLIEAASAWQLEQRARSISRKELGLLDTEKARTKMVPVTVCGFVNISGSKCRKMSVPGSIRCPEHGGALMSPEVRRAMLISAYCSIVTHTQLAVDALAEVAARGRNELARVQAAKELLDRAGLSPEIQIKVEIEGDTRSETIERLRERLDGMQRGLLARVLDTSAQEADPTEDFPINGNGYPSEGNGHDRGGLP